MIFLPSIRSLVYPKVEELILDSDTNTLLSAMSVEPNTARKSAINDLIVTMKADGIWSKLDEFWIYAAHTEQAGLLGWKRVRDSVKVNTPTFTTDRGFTTIASSSSVIDTQFNPATDGVNYQLNSVTLGVYRRTSTTTSSTWLIGCRQGGASTAQSFVYSNSTTSLATAFNRSSAISTVTVGASDWSGLIMGGRPSLAEERKFRNGVYLTGLVWTSAAIPTGRTFYVGALNDGSITGVNEGEYSAAFVGGSLSNTDHENLYDAVQAYMTAVGANV